MLLLSACFHSCSCLLPLISCSLHLNHYFAVCHVHNTSGGAGGVNGIVSLKLLFVCPLSLMQFHVSLCSRNHRTARSRESKNRRRRRQGRGRNCPDPRGPSCIGSQGTGTCEVRKCPGVSRLQGYPAVFWHNGIGAGNVDGLKPAAHIG